MNAGFRDVRFAGAIALVAAACLTASGASDPLAGRVEGQGPKPPEGYVPPLISNGELNMLVEWTGGQSDATYFRLEPTVYWQGRRGPAREAELFGFGKFMPEMKIDGVDAGLPSAWSQTLDIFKARTVCKGSFAGGIEAVTEVFCSLHSNVIAIRRRVRNSGDVRRQVHLGLGYRLPAHDRLTGSWSDGPRQRMYRGTTYGQNVIGFDIRITAADRGDLSRTFCLGPGEESVMDWFITYSDTFEKNRTRVPEVSWDGLFKRHAAAWADYYAESHVKLPDPVLQRMYDVQQYHLRCIATRWGFPVGVFPSHWQGKYFGFDAMYMHDGLVSAGHFSVAQRCPDWRQSVIGWALRRQSHYGRRGKYGARWMWMSLEEGDVETAGVGFWLDHIFAMGAIARSAWTQYTYSGDREYLRRTGYQVVYECARFFRNNWVHEEGDGVAYIGRCTDLERLGPSRDRGYLSTCSAIYALRSAADACDVLKTNLVDAADFRATADRLVKGLPVSEDGTRYVAYENCKEESVGTLGGLYPFPVFPAGDVRQSNAAHHFIEAGRSAGNMYPMGKKVCPWYAAKMSASMTELGDRTEPYRWLSEAAGTIGLFGETWEINEPGVRVRPWFATASGNCVFAVNEMLVRGTYPEDWKDLSFRLPDGRGGWVEVSR